MSNPTNFPKAVYPLQWPAGRNRLTAEARRASRFKVSFASAYDSLVDEIGKFGSVCEVVISSNVPIRDGLPEVKMKALGDPAVALHFSRYW